MFSMLAILGGISSAPLPPKVEQRVRASVTVVRGREISERGWRPATDPAQRQILHREPGGTTLLRLTEFQ